MRKYFDGDDNVRYVLAYFDKLCASIVCARVPVCPCARVCRAPIHKIKTIVRKKERKKNRKVSAFVGAVFICCLLLEPTHLIARLPRSLTH